MSREPAVASVVPSRATDVLVLLAALGFMVLVAKIGIVRHLLLAPQSQDLGATSHFLANPLQVGLGESVFVAPFIHVHVNATLVLLHPFTWLFDATTVLILAQALAMGGTAWLLYREALARTRDAPTAALLGVGLLVDPYVHLATLCDVQPEALTPLLLLLALRAYRLERHWAWALGLALAALMKENLPLVVLALAGVARLDGRGPRWWGPALGVGVAGVLLVAVRRRLVPEDGGFNNTAIFFGHLGETLPEVAWALASRPVEALRLCLDKPQPWPLLVPVLAAPLLRPRWLLPALPIVALHCLAAPWHLPMWWEFHGAVLLALVGHLALVDVAAGVRARRTQRGLAAAALLVSTVVLLPVARREARAFLDEWPDSTSARRRLLLERTPRAGRVVASTACLAPLADVPRLTWSELWISGRHMATGPRVLPVRIDGEVEAFALTLDAEGAALRAWPDGRRRLLALASRMVVRDQTDGWIVLARDGVGPPLLERVPRPVIPGGAEAPLVVEASTPPPSVTRGTDLRLDVFWRRGARPPEEVDLEATLSDAAGRVALRVRRPIAWALVPPAAAPGPDAPEALAETLAVFLPLELPPGPYRLALRAVTPDGRPVVEAGGWTLEAR